MNRLRQKLEANSLDLDLKKGWLRHSYAVTDLMLDFLKYDPTQWSVAADNTQTLNTYPERLGTLLVNVYKSIPDGRQSFDLQHFEGFVEALATLEWTPANPFAASHWNSLKAACLAQVSRGFAVLVKALGLAAANPRIIVLTQKLTLHGLSEANNRLLKVHLRAVGPIIADTARRYVEQHNAVQKLQSLLGTSSAAAGVTLAPAKSISHRKLGNSHQRRGLKQKMKASEKKKVKSLETTDLGAPVADAGLCRSLLELLLAVIVAAQCAEVDFSPLFCVNFREVPAEYQGVLLDLLGSYAVFSQKGKRKVEFLCTELLKDPQLRSLARTHLFYLSLPSQS